MSEKGQRVWVSKPDKEKMVEISAGPLDNPVLGVWARMNAGEVRRLINILERMGEGDVYDPEA